ncbi:MAG: hypothetical protein Q9186_000815 [Xanthomendoza sp. 1 TL-2023]
MSHRYEKTQLLVLLVTPSYISVLEEKSPFIPDLIRQTYHGLRKGRILDVLVAVVDRISYPASYASRAQVASGNQHKRRIGYTGNGISVMLTESETGAPDLWSPRGEMNGKTSPITQCQSTLSFKFGANVEDVGRGERTSFSSKAIKLPVANTIFHNGRESSLQAQRWVVGETILEATLACIRRTWLNEQVLQMAFPSPEEPNKFPLQVSVPLLALTRRKRVATSMGNVIRQVYDKAEPFPDGPPRDSPPEIEPASKDLESAVAQYISEKRDENTNVEIWAVITSPTSSLTYTTPNFSKVVKGGGHFHKVLGGGGGWGNRQGLLALDPEVDFDVTPELRLTENLDFEPPEEDRGRTSGQIVSPGDIAMFFCRQLYGSLSGTPSKAPGTPTDPGNSWILSRLPCFVFGTASSTIDDIPVPTSAISRASNSPHCIYVAQHFGMLSEQAVSVMLVRSDGGVSRTKIDVPHAVVSCGPQIARLQTTPLLYEQDLNPRKSMQHRVGSEDTSDGAAAPEPRSEYLTHDDTTSDPINQVEGLTVREATLPTPVRKVGIQEKQTRARAILQPGTGRPGSNSVNSKAAGLTRAREVKNPPNRTLETITLRKAEESGVKEFRIRRHFHKGT